MRLCVLLALVLVACSKPPPKIFGGLLSQPKYAEPYRELGQSTGQPLPCYEQARCQTFVVPNAEAKAFFEQVSRGMSDNGFRLIQNDNLGAQMLQTYLKDTRRLSLKMSAVSFDKTMFTYTDLGDSNP